MKIIERFLREGTLASQITSKHVVRVFEVGQLRPGLPYIAMELLDGKDLAAILRQSTRLSLEAAIDMIRQLAEGLAAAHDAGVIHRDLKPQNVFRCSDPSETWKILDFGVSKLVGSTDTLTRDQIVGTPGYMSVEQTRGLELDARSDLFSLGAVAYRALTGSPPFPGTEVPAILFDICYLQPKRPSSMVPALPPDIDRALAIALAKDPANRPEGATAFSRLFATALDGTLDPVLARHADALIAAHPWGGQQQRKGRLRSRADTFDELPPR
jgi:serine/threonine-protein kinase